MPPPAHCTHYLQQLIRDCMSAAPHARPTAQHIMQVTMMAVQELALNAHAAAARTPPAAPAAPPPLNRPESYEAIAGFDPRP